jgi:hypothetical protein
LTTSQSLKRSKKFASKSIAVEPDANQNDWKKMFGTQDVFHQRVLQKWKKTFCGKKTETLLDKLIGVLKMLNQVKENLRPRFRSVKQTVHSSALQR